MDGHDLAVLVPLWRRPHRVEPVVRSIVEGGTPNALVVLVVSDDDEATLEKALEWIADPSVATAILTTAWPGGARGDYARKINAAAANVKREWLFLGADDLLFHPGWYDRAREEADRHGALVVGTNDLGNRRTMRGQHSTHSLVARSYVEQGTIDEPGKLLHEGYEHEFCDDEFVRTAQHRGVYVHARGAWVEHLHPHWGKAPDDAIYAEAEARIERTRPQFNERASLWGGAGQVR